jgi:hypothetical protein
MDSFVVVVITASSGGKNIFRKGFLRRRESWKDCKKGV